MKFYLFLVSLVFLIGNATAADKSFTDLTVTCKPITITQNEEPETYQLKIEILSSDVSADGDQDAAAIIHELSSFTVHSGVLSLNGRVGKFISESKRYKVELNLTYPSGPSQLHIQYFDKGEWKNYYQGDASCSYLQYGSEGAHN